MEDLKTPRAFIIFTSTIRNIFDIFFFATLGIYYRVLWNKKVFHANLEILLVLFPLAYVVALIPAIVRDLIQHFYILSDRDNDWVDMVIDIGQYSASYNLLVLVTERAVATLYVARYEYICSRTPWLGSLLALFQWTVCVTLLFINYYYSGRVIDAEPLLYSVGISCATAAVVFALLPLISRYVYRIQFQRRFSNQRYQSIENIRSATVLLRLVLLSALGQLLCGALYAYILLMTRKPLRLYYQNLYYALLALFATLLNYVVVHSHPTLRKEFLRLTRLEKYFRRKDSTETISSVQGSRLDIPLSEHSEFYFRSYRNSW